MKTIIEQLTCARRELAMRRSAYPKWVAAGRMKPEAAQHETECMAAIVETLEKMAWLEEVSREMQQPPKPKPEAQCRLIDFFPDPIRQFALFVGHP